MKKRLTKQEKAAEEELFAFRKRATMVMQEWEGGVLMDAGIQMIQVDLASATKLQTMIIDAMRWAQERGNRSDGQ